MADLEKLTIKIEVDDSKAVNQLKTFMEKVRAVTNAINNGSTDDPFKKFEANMPRTAKKVEGLTKTIYKHTEAIKRLKEVSDTAGKPTFSAKTGQSQELVDNAKKTEEALKKVNETTERIKPKGLQRIVEAIKRVPAAAKTLPTTFRNIKEAISNAFERAKPIVEKFGNVIRGIGVVVKKVASVFSFIGSVASKVGSGIVSAWRKTLPIIESVGRAFKKIGSYMLSLPLAPVKAIGGAISNINGFLKRTIKALLRLARVRFFRSIIKGIITGFKEGISNAYQWANVVGNQLAGSLDSLATSSLYLKNSFAALAAPLINSLAPAIDYVVDKLVDLLNIFNQVISKLTGQSSWVKAVKVPKAYADSMADAAGSAKALNEELITILGIDEINPMDADKDKGRGSGSGAGAGADYSSMFEEMEEFSENANNWADMIRDAWERADFTEIGTIIGNKITDALNKIPWNNIKTTTRKVGTSFATLLNGVMEGTDFSLVGKTIAEALNSLVVGVNASVKAFKWGVLGTSVGEAINGALSNISWYNIEQTATTIGSGVATAINNAVDTTDWTTVGDTIGKALNTVVDEAFAFVTTLDFADIGSSLATTLNSAIETTDWGKLGTTFSTTINGMIEAGKNFVEEFDFADFGSSLGTALQNAINGIKWGEGGYTLNTFVSGVLDSIKGLFDAFDWNELGTNIATFLNNALTGDDVWTKAGTTFSTAINSILKTAKTTVKNFDFSKFGSSVASGISSALKNINIDDLTTVAEKVGTGLADAINSLFASDESGDSVLTRIGRVVGGGINAAVAGAKAFITETNWGELADEVASGVKSLFDEISWTDITETISSAFSGIVEFLQTLFDDIDWVEVGNKLGEAIAAIDWWNDVIVPAFNLIGKVITIPLEILSGIGGATEESIIADTEAALAAETGGFSGSYTPKVETPEIDVIANVVELNNAIPEDKNAVDNVTANASKLDSKGIAEKLRTVKDVIAKASQFNGEGIKTKEVTNVTAKASTLTDSIKEAAKVVSNVTAKAGLFKDGIKEDDKYISGMTAELTGNPVKGVRFKAEVPDLVASFSGDPKLGSSFNTTITDLTARFTARSKDDKKVPTTWDGWTAKFTKRDKDNSALPTVWDGWTAMFTKRGKDDKALPTVWDGWTAKFTGRKKDDKALPTVWSGWTAKFTGRKKDNSALPTVWSGWTAKFTAREKDNAKVPTTWTGWVAEFIDSIVAGDFNNILKMYAQILGATNTPTIKANIQADKILTKGGATLQLKALGGAFYNNKWHSIPQYATGTLNAGSLFVAGEAGPELVGHVGGRTEVLNQSQLASTMASSMAMATSTQNRLLQEQNNLLGELIQKQASGRNYVTSGDVIDALSQRNRRDGRTIISIGA